jgi:hypothetical protein
MSHHERRTEHLLARLAGSVPERPVPLGRLLAGARRARRRRHALRAAGASLAAVAAVAAAFAVGTATRTTATTDPVPTVARDTASPTPSFATCAPGPKHAPDHPPWPTRPPYPTNAAGQTYGSDAGARGPEESPDLVAVVGDCNRVGYVLSADLDGPRPRTPSEAASLSADPRPRVLPVYQQDGTTQVDTFTLTPSTVVSGSGPAPSGR